MLKPSEIFNASILIVDDQAANVLLLTQMLQNAGYQSIASTMDPRMVCTMHLANHYDLILLDLQMPVMDGFEVIEALKEIEPDAYLPVLVIATQPGHKLRALQAGAKDFVSKPFDLVEMQTRVHNMLEVRLLYQKLGNYNKVLEQAVYDRTAELRESEARFRSFTELSSDWYWEQDRDGKFTKVSGPVFEMLGIETGTMRGEASKVLAGWNPSARALLAANIAARRPFLDFVYSRSKPDGSMQYLQVSGEPMFDSSSRFIGYRGIGMDVTERRCPDPQQVRLRAALDVIDQGVCLLDRASMRVIDMNSAACRITGYGLEARSQIDAADFGIAQLDGVFDRLIAAAQAQTNAQARAAEQAARLRRKDGALLDVTISWHAVQVSDTWIVVGVIVVCGAWAGFETAT